MSAEIKTWLPAPTSAGWWWWHNDTVAPEGLCVLVHPDGETDVNKWWVYLPKTQRPKQLRDLFGKSQWCGPVTKPEMPKV